MSINRKAREEWEKKQADVEKLQKANEVSYPSFHFERSLTKFLLVNVNMENYVICSKKMTIWKTCNLMTWISA